MRLICTAVTTFAMCLSLTAGSARAQQTEQHHHHHGNKHRTMKDGTRFITSRTGAELLLPNEDEAFSFIVFGDRTGGPAEGVKVLQQAVEDVNAIEPDLVMTVGDLVQGYNQTAEWTEQMTEYKGIMSKLLMPWFPVAGNHDVIYRGPDKPQGQHEASYEKHFGPLWYAFEHKNCWFIALFSDEGDRSTNDKGLKPELQKMSDEQFNWLKQTLEKTRDAQHVFVFLHHPRWHGGERYGDDWQRVHKLLADAGNVRIVFAGHIHRMRYDGVRDGIEYVTLAKVGASSKDYGEEAGYLHEFHLITVRPKQIAMAALPVGTVMDVRSVTGKVSEAAETIGLMNPDVSGGLATQSDGAIGGTFRLSVSNPVDEPIDVTLMPQSGDTRWRFRPDHVHKTLKPGETIGVDFTAAWPATGGVRDESFRGVEAVVQIDYLAGGRRFSLPEKRQAVAIDGVTGGERKAAEPAPARKQAKMKAKS